MILWPHQTVAINKTLDAIKRGQPSGLIASPCGTGKTTIFTELARRLGWPTLVLCHRDELIRQTVDTFADLWPRASVGVIKAERDEWRDRDVVVVSVQSLHNGRLERMPRDRFGLVVADECHHAAAQSWTRILQHFNSRFRLGCSATPERLDGKSLSELFVAKALFIYQLRDAIEDDRLVRLAQYQIRTDADLSGVGYRMGDFAGGELSRIVNTPARNRVVVEAFQEQAPARRAIAFCVDVAHTIDLASAFRKVGITAGYVTGTTPIEERRQLLADFAAGEIQVLTNCEVLTEGFDDRGVDCVLMARPTASRGLYQQCVGRGLRLYPGKSDCLIFDFTDNSSKHKLVTVMDLLGAPQATNAAGGDVLEAVDCDIRRAEETETIARTEVLAWRLECVCPWPELPTLKGYSPKKPWESAPASDKQLDFLKRLGLSFSRVLSRGEASFLLDRALQYEAVFPGPATSRQERFLRHRDAWVDGMSKRDASKIIGELKKCVA